LDIAIVQPKPLNSSTQRNNSIEVDYSIRYADNWTDISFQAKFLTGYKCVLCHIKCFETHHALYADKLGSIAGREIPGVHVFPLCARHHKEAHSRKNWIHSSNPVLGNRNTVSFYLRLRQGWINTSEKLSQDN
jgi:hypothetical protein